MEKSRFFDKTIARLLFSGLVLGLVFVFYAQERLYTTLVDNSLALGSEKYLRIGSVVFIFLTVLLAIFQSKSKFSFKIHLAYLVLVLYITLVYLSYGASMFDMTVLMSTKGLGPWICFGLIFVSYNDSTYRKFNRFLIIAIIFIFGLTIYNLIDFGVGLYRGQAMSKYRLYAVSAMWIAPYVFLKLKNHEKYAKYRSLVLFFGVCLALIVQTRSFLLVYFFVLVFDFYYAKNKIQYIIIAAILAPIYAYLLLKSESLSSSYELLGERGLRDSRLGQLAQFSQQVNFFELVVGKGPFATWSYSSGQEYQYLDNQWILLLWWAGLIPFLMYLYLTAYIPIKMFFTNDDYQTKVESFILILWALACAGIAVFSTMSVNFYFYVICIIQGRLLYKYSIRKY